MEIKQIRQLRLKQWFANRTIPEKEKSYLSQLINGKASFGERAARRLEQSYQMPTGFLDRAIINVDAFAEEKITLESIVPANFKQLPVLSWEQIGNWDGLSPITVEQVDEWIDVMHDIPDDSFVVKIIGDSLCSPQGVSIPDGAYVVFEPIKDSIERFNGKIVLIQRQGEIPTIKKLSFDGADLYLLPINPALKIKEVENIEQIILKGKVRQIIQQID